MGNRPSTFHCIKRLVHLACRRSSRVRNRPANLKFVEGLVAFFKHAAYEFGYAVLIDIRHHRWWRRPVLNCGRFATNVELLFLRLDVRALRCSRFVDPTIDIQLILKQIRIVVLDNTTERAQAFVERFWNGVVVYTTKH